jgi:hypothetical protein
MTPWRRKAAGVALQLTAVLSVALATLLLTLLPAIALAQSGAPAQPARLCIPQTTVLVTGTAPPSAALLLRFAGRVVGGGVSGADGSYRLTLQVGRERPGTYTVSVALRVSGEELQRFPCEVPGATTAPTQAPPAGATPATPRTPSSPLLPTPTAVPTPSPRPTNPPLTRPASDFDRDGDQRVTCADFDTQADAREALDAGYVDLDDDRDGVPCETLPTG